jgi:hypothetical protein
MRPLTSEIVADGGATGAHIYGSIALEKAVPELVNQEDYGMQRQ